jgi:hypothetical protein
MASPSNPYASSGSALGRLNAPGITLIVLGILGVLGAIAGVLMNLLGMGGNLAGMGGRESGGPMDQYITLMSGGLGLVLNILNVFLSALIAFGGFKMRTGESYPLALTASILCIVPCTSPCCCLIGIPVGIWALIVLMDKDVKASFR